MNQRLIFSGPAAIHKMGQALLPSSAQGSLPRLLIFLLFLALSGSAAAQLNRQEVLLKMLDGSELIGKLIAEDQTSLIIETTSLGQLNILRSEVKVLIRSPEGGRAGWHATRDAARNIFGPTTGYNPPKGKGYYQNYMLLVNQVHYGLTDHFSLGMGLELASLLENALQLPSVALYPKVSIPVVENQFQIGLGAVFTHLADFGPSTFDFVNYYTALTYGPPDRHISVGLGYTRIDGDYSASPLYILGGQYRFTRSFALATENWLARGPTQGSLLSLSGRIIGQRTSWDLGVILLVYHEFFGNEIIPLPLLGFTVPF